MPTKNLVSTTQLELLCGHVCQLKVGLTGPKNCSVKLRCAHINLPKIVAISVVS